jgi:Fe-S-cluster containining protein
MFPCTSCGLCCQNISEIEELKNFDLGNGTCKHFNHISNECNIYETRPNICRVDKMFDIKYHQSFTKEEFHMVNAQACNALQEQYGIDSDFRIKIIGE